MEERSIRVYQDKTFFNKITNTINKLLTPTKIGFNSFLMTIKRNNMMKWYEAYKNIQTIEDENKKENITQKFDDMYALYLETVDKYIMDTIYKKVKSGTASEFEREALSKYYLVTHLKEIDYLEYKYKKQIYLLNLDYENVTNSGKDNLINRYKEIYLAQIEILYKGLLKNYSIKLADNLTPGAKDMVYNKIFDILGEYIENILPLKKQQEPDNKLYNEIIDSYSGFENFTVGKLDQNDNIEKNMHLLGISRKLFTHSLPLIVAEQCYEKLLNDTRSLIVDTKVIRKQEKAYSLLIGLIEEYNVKLLATKIYWDKPELRNEYKKFWDSYKETEKLKETNKELYIKEKQILFIRNDLKEVLKNENKYFKLIKFYKNKLVELGAMQNLRNSYVSEGVFKKLKNSKSMMEII